MTYPDIFCQNVKITAIIAVIVLVGGGGVAAATYAGQVDWNDYFSKPGQYIDYKENWYGQTYSVIHTNAAKADDGLYYAVTKFEFHDQAGYLVLQSSMFTITEEEQGYTFTWPGDRNQGGGSVYIPGAHLAESTVYILPNLQDYSTQNQAVLQEIYDRYGITGNPQIAMWWNSDHFELYYGYIDPPEGVEGEKRLIDANFIPPLVPAKGDVYIISDINKIEVQHVAETKDACNDQIYSAENFFNRVAESNCLRLVQTSP